MSIQQKELRKPKIKRYLKNIYTGEIKPIQEWLKTEVSYFRKFWKDNEDNLSKDFANVEEYLFYLHRQGVFQDDLIECDEKGNAIYLKESLFLSNLKGDC